MQTETVEQLLARKRAEKGEAPPSQSQSPFYSQHPLEWPLPLWIELRFNNGLMLSFNTSDLSWISYEPENACIDFRVEGFGVTVKGRGLYPKLYEALRTKRVAWLKEADSDMQISKDGDVYIESIFVTEPE